MATIRFLLILSLCCQSIAAEPIYLVTSSGLFRAEIGSDGTPGPWSQIRNVMFARDDSPSPTPQPTPPKPEPAPISKNVRLCVIESHSDRSVSTADVLDKLVGWTEFQDAGNEFRLYRTNTSEPRGLKAIRDAGQTSLPAVVLYDRSSGAILKVCPLPGTFAELQNIANQRTATAAKPPRLSRLMENLDAANRSAERLRNAL